MLSLLMNRYKLNFRYIPGTASTIQVEPAHPMNCTISDIFEANSTFNLENKVLTSINSTFELSSEDISQVSNLLEHLKLWFIALNWSFVWLKPSWSLFLTTMEKLDQEATAISARDSSFQLDSTKLQPNNLFIGNKALIFVYSDNFNVYKNFW